MSFTFSAPSTEQKKRPVEDRRIVHIVNTHDSLTFKDAWDDKVYIFPPKSYAPVPIAAAKNWLGDSDAEDWNMETARLKARYGFDRNLRNSGVVWLELVASGKLHCPEFGVNHIKEVHNSVKDNRDQVMAMPLGNMENFGGEGAIPLTKEAFEEFQNRAMNIDRDSVSDLSEVALDISGLSQINVDELFVDEK